MSIQDTAISIMKVDLDHIDSLIQAGLYLDRNSCIQAAIAQMLAAHNSKQPLVPPTHFTFRWVDKSIPAC